MKIIKDKTYILRRYELSIKRRICFNITEVNTCPVENMAEFDRRPPPLLGPNFRVGLGEKSVKTIKIINSNQIFGLNGQLHYGISQ